LHNIALHNIAAAAPAAARPLRPAADVEFGAGPLGIGVQLAQVESVIKC
jgi:hypothetical protein